MYSCQWNDIAQRRNIHELASISAQGFVTELPVDSFAQKSSCPDPATTRIAPEHTADSMNSESEGARDSYLNAVPSPMGVGRIPSAFSPS